MAGHSREWDRQRPVGVFPRSGDGASWMDKENSAPTNTTVTGRETFRGIGLGDVQKTMMLADNMMMSASLGSSTLWEGFKDSNSRSERDSSGFSMHCNNKTPGEALMQDKMSILELELRQLHSLLDVQKEDNRSMRIELSSAREEKKKLEQTLSAALADSAKVPTLEKRCKELAAKLKEEKERCAALAKEVGRMASSRQGTPEAESPHKASQWDFHSSSTPTTSACRSPTPNSPFLGMMMPSPAAPGPSARQFEGSSGAASRGLATSMSRRSCHSVVHERHTAPSAPLAPPHEHFEWGVMTASTSDDLPCNAASAIPAWSRASGLTAARASPRPRPDDSEEDNGAFELRARLHYKCRTVISIIRRWREAVEVDEVGLRGCRDGEDSQADGHSHAKVPSLELSSLSFITSQEEDDAFARQSQSPSSDDGAGPSLFSTSHTAAARRFIAKTSDPTTAAPRSLYHSDIGRWARASPGDIHSSPFAQGFATPSASAGERGASSPLEDLELLLSRAELGDARLASSAYGNTHTGELERSALSGASAGGSQSGSTVSAAAKGSKTPRDGNANSPATAAGTQGCWRQGGQLSPAGGASPSPGTPTPPPVTPRLGDNALLQAGRRHSAFGGARPPSPRTLTVSDTADGASSIYWSAPLMSGGTTPRGGRLASPRVVVPTVIQTVKVGTGGRTPPPMPEYGHDV